MSTLAPSFTNRYILVFKQDKTGKIFFRIVDNLKQRPAPFLPNNCRLVGSIYLAEKENFFPVAAVVSCDKFDTICVFLESVVAYLVKRERRRPLKTWNLDAIGANNLGKHAPKTAEGYALVYLLTSAHGIIYSTNFLLDEIRKILASTSTS